MFPETCLHSQVRSCWLKAEVTKAAAVGHQESMLGEEGFVPEEFEHSLWLFLPDLLSTRCSVLRWGEVLCLSLWGSLGSIQGAVATLPYWNEAGKNFSIKYAKTWHDQVFSAKELLGITIWCWSSLFLLGSQFICLLAWYSFAGSSLGWKWEDRCYSSTWGSTACLRSPSS